MSAADRLEDGFPHGTVAGYQQGCKGGDCPSGVEVGLSCRRAKQLVAGDYRYQKLVRAGKSPSEIADELGLMPEVHAAPAPPKKTAAVPYDEEDVPATVDDEQIEEKETAVETTVEEVAAPAPAAENTEAPVVLSHAERVRRWCRENGITVGDRGALPKRALDAFDAANPTLAAVELPKPKAPKTLKPMTPAVQPPALSEPVEHELAGIQHAAAEPSSDEDARDEEVVDDAPVEIHHSTIPPRAGAFPLTASDLREIATALDAIDVLPIEHLTAVIERIPVVRPGGGDVVGYFEVADGDDAWFGFTPETAA